MDSQTASYYARHANTLAVSYEQVSADYFKTLDDAFSDCVKILDVGCGTGRDCLHLLKQGKDVYGSEPSPEMRSKAKEHFEAASVTWQNRLHDASLPGLVPFDDGFFDGVLCTAVLMHLPEEQIFDAVYGLRRVLRHGGVLVVSTPQSRDDINPETRRDADGRLFTELPPAKLELLFERVGFRLEKSHTMDDSLARAGITWRTMILRRLDDASDRPLHLVEGILNRDNKVATYKLALFRAMSEIAQTQSHLARFTDDGKVTIPNQAIAEKWLLYYWPIFASQTLIRQGTSSTGADVAIRPKMEPLIAHYANRGGLSAFYVDWRSGRLGSEAQRLANAALSKLRNTIWSMPVKHAGGGGFAILQYDRNEKSVVMDASLWRELCLTGNWIQDATVLRWAELTELFNKRTVKASTVIDCLLTVPSAERNVVDARKFYTEWDGDFCVWTDRRLKGRFEVDHAIPFSLWRNNDLWNLLPASNSANREKRDNLPSYNLLQKRRDSIIHCWRSLDEYFGERFRNEARTLMGIQPLVESRWEIQLFTRFVEAFETTATQRGAARWEPARQTTASTAPRTTIAAAFDSPETERQIPFPIHEIGDGAFRTHLPIVASLAAGTPFQGFETRDLNWLEDCDWLEVPSSLAKRDRFIVRIVGDSMEPTLPKNSLAVFEWHRTPRRSGQIVIANIPEFGPGQDSSGAVKRYREDSTEWIFESDNPNHKTIRVSKIDIAYPILGTFVAKI
ncbi:MAG: methyltransferase domain-containing protein [Opitutales bacterium]|nr:methyltransferase domain-containing protein [Opitutales bacterium]